MNHRIAFAPCTACVCDCPCHHAGEGTRIPSCVCPWVRTHVHVADGLSTVSALTATYHAPSRRALDGHTCGQCDGCTSGQLLCTRLAHVRVRSCTASSHAAYARVYGRHAQRGILPQAGVPPEERRIAEPAPAATACGQICIVSLCSRDESSAASRSIRIEPDRGARASAAHPGHSVAACTPALTWPLLHIAA